MKDLEKFEQELLLWPDVSIHPHRFGGREFRIGSAEIGHVHPGGILDIPFPRVIHDMLLAEDAVEEHRWVPNSGWITFRVHTKEDIRHALWLLRLSYLRYKLKSAPEPFSMLEQEARELRINSQLKSLLQQFIPAKANHALQARPH